MDGFIGQSDGVIRLAVFLGVFLVMALIELDGRSARPAFPRGGAGSPMSALA
jgi:hypothetical protein